jgi:hypothetical protein
LEENDIQMGSRAITMEKTMVTRAMVAREEATDIQVAIMLLLLG